MSTSAFSSQYVISISLYIVVAVVKRERDLDLPHFRDFRYRSVIVPSPLSMTR